MYITGIDDLEDEDIKKEFQTSKGSNRTGST